VSPDVSRIQRSDRTSPDIPEPIGSRTGTDPVFHEKEKGEKNKTKTKNTK
jgi:hypothetical protein